MGLAIEASIANRGTTMMHRTMTRMNIARFCNMMAEETDETKLLTLRRLIAEQEAKLVEPTAPANEGQG
jgi:hypothetical protein